MNNVDLKDINFVAWLMYTPKEKIPEHAMHLPQYDDVGIKIMELIQNNVISISGMNEKGLLEINVHV